ncbi:MAG: Grx4 family monothiol glutaredoxin [Bdellovibrionaceae bacterium]|nr:Grx4 family monothiol glutaredoxin [Pseudobdellovibrionaceae bacterium]
MEKNIRNLVEENQTFLFMKGDKTKPLCGFSAQVVSALNAINVPFESFNILTDGQMRQAVKEYSNWPTYPQLYHKGKFIGGCDIVMEMQESGDLASALKTAE